MTAAAGTSAMFEERIDPGRIASFVLAAAMHLALFAVLVFGVRWQNRPPEAVQVELWVEPEPAPLQVEPKPAPVPEPMVAKPEPVTPKPEIMLKAPEKIKPLPKPVAKAEPPKPKAEDAKKRMREELAREQASFAVDRERQRIKDQLAREAAAASSRVLAGWTDKVRVKIRGNIAMPLDMKGNPEAIFDVVLLPSGDLLDVRLRKSSGYRAYDDAVERAIRKSSAFPKPDGSMPIPRELELKFRPVD